MPIQQTLTVTPGLKLNDGLSKTDLRGFEDSLPGPLPSEIESLLRYASGFESKSIGSVDFTGRSNRFEFKEVVPHGVPIAQINGSYWVQDINEDGGWGGVFFFSHDPPIATLQFDSLDSFVKAAVQDGNVGEEANRLSLATWQDVNSGVSIDDAMGSGDDKLMNFVRSLPHGNFRIFDLRAATGSKGFAWGRGGPDLECRRASLELIFAVAVKEQRKSLISRIYSALNPSWEEKVEVICS